MTKYTLAQKKKMPTSSDLAHLNTFIVVSASEGFWGKGKSIKEARANCAKQGARKQMHAWIATDDVVCNGGYIEATRHLSLGEI